VPALTERTRRETTRAEIVELLGATKAAAHVIEPLRRKGWLERATPGEYLLIPPEQGPDALGDSKPPARQPLATGMHSPWVSRLLRMASSSIPTAVAATASSAGATYSRRARAIISA